MPTREELDQLCTDLPRIIQELPRARVGLADGICIKPLLLTKRTKCIWCKDEAGHNQPLQRRRADIDITLITNSYSKVQTQLSVGHCYRWGADYFPDRVVKKDDESGELRQFYIDDTPYLRISKPAKLWTYGPNGHVNAFNQPQFEQAALTDEQSYRMFAEHMVRVLGLTLTKLEPGTTSAFNTTFDPTTKELIIEANTWFITSQRGILPGALSHTCKDCTHTKCYRANVEQGHGVHVVAELPDDGEEFQPPNGEGADLDAAVFDNVLNVT
ncbi:hypothetical protein FRC05_004973 [Tulasnella sp. 425]|nr:hypothetical protein FRC05_004973 [Tulasnella sp. 425]